MDWASRQIVQANGLAWKWNLPPVFIAVAFDDQGNPTQWQLDPLFKYALEGQPQLRKRFGFE